MTDATIFDGATTPVETVVTPQVTLPTEVVELVGEGKKYRTAEDALKALPHAQKHISTLEEEAKQLREELARRKAAEELLEEFKTSGVLGGQHNPQTHEQTSVDYEQIVASVLAKEQAKLTAKQNQETVVSAFTTTFGDKTKGEEMYNKVAEESGLSIAALNQLAATSPEAVMRLAGITKKQETIPGKVNSTVNPQAFNDKPQGELSARLKPGASTKDMVSAWRVAGEKVKQQFSQ